MPDDQQKAPEVPTKSKNIKTLIIVGGIMVAEAGLIFGVMKVVGASPADANAGEMGEAVAGEADSSDDQGEGAGAVGEVLLVKTDAYNNRSGRLYIYHIQVSALVEAQHVSALEKLVEERQGTIEDRINTVIRGADPAHLNEPGLETLRRQIKFELDKVSGDPSLLLEVLIPKLLQSRSNL